MYIRTTTPFCSRKKEPEWGATYSSPVGEVNSDPGPNIVVTEFNVSSYPSQDAMGRKPSILRIPLLTAWSTEA
jgi:hypothetical protein